MKTKIVGVLVTLFIILAGVVFPALASKEKSLPEMEIQAEAQSQQFIEWKETRSFQGKHTHHNGEKVWNNPGHPNEAEFHVETFSIPTWLVGEMVDAGLNVNNNDSHHLFNRMEVYSCGKKVASFNNIEAEGAASSFLANFEACSTITFKYVVGAHISSLSGIVSVSGKIPAKDVEFTASCETGAVAQNPNPVNAKVKFIIGENVSEWQDIPAGGTVTKPIPYDRNMYVTSLMWKIGNTVEGFVTGPNTGECAPEPTPVPADPTPTPLPTSTPVPPVVGTPPAPIPTPEPTSTPVPVVGPLPTCWKANLIKFDQNTPYPGVFVLNGQHILDWSWQPAKNNWDDSYQSQFICLKLKPGEQNSRVEIRYWPYGMPQFAVRLKFHPSNMFEDDPWAGSLGAGDYKSLEVGFPTDEELAAAGMPAWVQPTNPPNGWDKLNWDPQDEGDMFWTTWGDYHVREDWIPSHVLNR